MATVPEPVNNMLAGYVSLLPIFKGDGSPPTINDFFILFEEIAYLAQWNSSQKLILAKSRCRDMALQYLLDSVDVKSVKEFDEFKILMIEHFRERVPMGQRMQEFLACVQKETETVPQFATRIKKFSTYLAPQLSEQPGAEARIAAKQVTDSLLLGQFLTGINQSIRRFVLAQNPPTLEKAIEAATQEEVNDRLTKQIAQIRLVDRADIDQQMTRGRDGQIAQLAPTRHYYRQPKTLPLCLHPPGTCRFEKSSQLPSCGKRRQPGEANPRYTVLFGAGRARTYRRFQRDEGQEARRPGQAYPRAIPLARGRPVGEERAQYGQMFSPVGRQQERENVLFKERKKKTPTKRMGRA